MRNSGSSPLAGKAITAVAAGVAALGLGAWSFASSSSSPSIDSYAQKQQQMSAATATTQQIYLQLDPEPISNCYGFIQDTVEVREGVDPAPTLNIQRQHIKSKEITTNTGFSEEQHKSVPMDEQVDLQRLEEFLLSSLNDYKILKNQRPHQTLNLNNYPIP